MPFGYLVDGVIGESGPGSPIEHAAKVGVGTWIGMLIGTAAGLAVAFMMLETFALALLL
ncbi:MAG TPA: hypothetical protein VKV22_00320 [Rhodanobacteraceae bacterium]|nr:hypothetical protein [Rhodanobacteraceae bacterium]